MNALSLHIDNLTFAEAEARILRYLRDDSFYHQIATVNPDFVMLAQKDPVFRHIVNHADLTLPDGIGIALPAFLSGTVLKERIPGVELAEHLMGIAEHCGYTVYLATRADGLSKYEEVRDALQKLYPSLNILGRNINISDPAEMEAVRESIKADIVLCNFGAPHQDMFIASLRSSKGAKLGIGVVGTFDFWTGRLKRAPKIVRIFGFEWLWRLFLQPKRLGRTYNYVVVYSYLCVKQYLGMEIERSAATWHRWLTPLRIGGRQMVGRFMTFL